MTAREGLKFTLELGFQNIEIDGDAQKLIRIILLESPTQTDVAVVATGIWELQSKLWTCKLDLFEKPQMVCAH